MSQSETKRIVEQARADSESDAMALYLLAARVVQLEAEVAARDRAIEMMREASRAQ